MRGKKKKNQNKNPFYPVCSFTVVVIDFDTQPAGQSERRGSQLKSISEQCRWAKPLALAQADQ